MCGATCGLLWAVLIFPIVEFQASAAAMPCPVLSQRISHARRCTILSYILRYCLVLTCRRAYATSKPFRVLKECVAYAAATRCPVLTKRMGLAAHPSQHVTQGSMSLRSYP
eukprot:3426852-Rhodomonas_salina.15